MRISLLAPVLLASTARAYVPTAAKAVTRRFASARRMSSSSPEKVELPPISPTAKRLFLVRHGEVINPGGVDRPVYYGNQDIDLSPLGKLEAIAAAEFLQQYPLQHVASSPLRRAKYGAKQVLELQDKDNNEFDLNDFVVLDGLTELNRGAWCGQTKDEIGANQMQRFDDCDVTVTPEGGESYPDLKARVLQARNVLLLQTKDGCASAIVSHLQVTRSILSDAMDLPVEEMANLSIATASITCIDYDSEEEGPQVHFQSFKPNVGLAAAKDGAN